MDYENAVHSMDGKVCSLDNQQNSWSYQIRSGLLMPRLLLSEREINVNVFLAVFHLDISLAAKSLQLCLTLCDPIDGSPPGSPVLGILQARTWSGLPFPSPMHESEKGK